MGFPEQIAGIEPVSPAWEASVLPMNYICIIGATGFEPATSRPPAVRATKLRHTPTTNISIPYFEKKASSFLKKIV